MDAKSQRQHTLSAKEAIKHCSQLGQGPSTSEDIQD
jgi:hypothetical protein